MCFAFSHNDTMVFESHELSPYMMTVEGYGIIFLSRDTLKGRVWSKKRGALGLDGTRERKGTEGKGRMSMYCLLRSRYAADAGQPVVRHQGTNGRQYGLSTTTTVQFVPCHD